MKNILILILTCLSSAAFAAAGGGAIRVGGGGGGGVASGANVVLLDFYNEGLDASAQLAPAQVLDQGFWQDLYVNGELKNLGEPVAYGVIMKIEQLESGDPVFAAALVESLRLLSWRFVNAELLKTDDLAMSQSVTGAPVISLAVRQGQTISISQPNWLKMETTNQIGLILHEVIEALAPVGAPPEMTRHLVAHLFTSDFFTSAGRRQWPDALQGFPSVSIAQKKIDALPHGTLNNLYTRATFLQPTDPYAFVTHPETLQLRIGSDFLFEPFEIISEQQQRRWPFSASAEVVHPEDELDPSNLTNLCHQPNGGLQEIGLSVYVYHVVITAVPLDDANLPPNLKWDIKEVHLADVKLQTTRSGKASCSAANQSQLSLLTNWTRMLTTF